MMAISHLLEDFSSPPRIEEPARWVSDDDWEDHRLTAFEQGYGAGWEDAMRVAAEDASRVSEELARGLEDISFSYHEALAQMLTVLEPLFASLMDAVLPEAVAKSFGHHVVAQLRQMAEEQASGPVVLVLPAGAGAAIRPMLERDFAMPVELREDPALAPGRAFVRLGEAEREIDCQRLIASLAAAVEAFTYETIEEARHG
ncbi:MAG: ABC transporter ATP-binding protein [Jhaorihella sp.]